MSDRPSPPKPWERSRPSGATSSSPPTPAEGMPKPWEGSPNSGTQNTAQPQALRPWERTALAGSTPGGAAYSSPYGGAGGAYGSSLYNRPGYGSMYGTGGYGAGYGAAGGGYGGMYGGAGGMYGGSSMYGGGGMYGRPMYGAGGYGGGMYGGGMGMGMMGMGGPGMMMGGPGGPWDPNDPNAPPAPPSAWQAMMAGVSGIMHFFGRLSFLVDENAHAVHFFVSALLQLLDRFGSLYGELARFVLRLLGIRTKEKKDQQTSGAAQEHQQQQLGHLGMRRHAMLPGAPGPATPPQGGGGGPWDSVWTQRQQ